MAVAKKSRIARLDRNLENLLVFSTGALAANSVRARRQASFTTDLKLAIVAVGIALLLLSAVLFWSAIRSAQTSRKDHGPEATQKPKVQSHSAERLRSLIPITNVSFRSAPESKAVTRRAVSGRTGGSIQARRSSPVAQDKTRLEIGDLAQTEAPKLLARRIQL